MAVTRSLFIMGENGKVVLILAPCTLRPATEARQFDVEFMSAPTPGFTYSQSAGFPSKNQESTRSLDFGEGNQGQAASDRVVCPGN